jgi:hypothetical protein
MQRHKGVICPLDNLSPEFLLPMSVSPSSPSSALPAVAVVVVEEEDNEIPVATAAATPVSSNE